VLLSVAIICNHDWQIERVQTLHVCWFLPFLPSSLLTFLPMCYPFFHFLRPSPCPLSAEPLPMCPATNDKLRVRFVEKRVTKVGWYEIQLSKVVEDGSHRVIAPMMLLRVMQVWLNALTTRRQHEARHGRRHRDVTWWRSLTTTSLGRRRHGRRAAEAALTLRLTARRRSARQKTLRVKGSTEKVEWVCFV